MQRSSSLIPPHLKFVMEQLIDGKADWPLLIYGNVGTGKTCAALAMCDFCDGWYRTMRQVMLDINDAKFGRLSVNGFNVSLRSYWSKMQAKSLVVIDELGTIEDPKGQQREALCEILEQRHGMPSVFISNLHPSKLEKVYDNRVVSRLTAGTVVSVGGPDRRDWRSKKNDQ